MSTTAPDQRKALVDQAARLGAVDTTLDDARKVLIERATVQRDTMNAAIEEAEGAVEAHPGNVLLQRRLDELLRERATLDRVIANHTARMNP